MMERSSHDRCTDTRVKCRDGTVPPREAASGISW